MIDIQQVFQTLYRNNQQISLLQANNDQLLELLMQAGAVQAAAQVQQMMAAANGHHVEPELPALPAPAKRGRPPLERLDSLGRRITRGNSKPGPRTGATWSPEQRAKRAATLAAKKGSDVDVLAGMLDASGRPIGKRAANWSPKTRARVLAEGIGATRRPSKPTSGKGWNAASRARLSKAMKEADRRKKAEGAAYKTKLQLAKEEREAQA